MRHKFLVLTVKKFLKSVYIYGSYRKIKTALSLFLDHSVHCPHCWHARQVGLQDGWAIAKKTARCAQYIGAL